MATRQEVLHIMKLYVSIVIFALVGGMAMGLSQRFGVLLGTNQPRLDFRQGSC